MEYQMPDQKKLKAEYLIKYKEEFLTLNGLKVGDKVEMEFPFDRIHTIDRRGGQQKVSFDKLCEGILKEDENGFLYAESIETMPFYHRETKGRSEYYVREMKPSIKKFGIGFLLF